MDIFVGRCGVDVRVDEWVDVWVNVLVGVWVDACMDIFVSGWMGNDINKHMNYGNL